MASDLYLQIDGIKGESYDAAHMGWIEVDTVTDCTRCTECGRWCPRIGEREAQVFQGSLEVHSAKGRRRHGREHRRGLGPRVESLCVTT